MGWAIFMKFSKNFIKVLRGTTLCLLNALACSWIQRILNLKALAHPWIAKWFIFEIGSRGHTGELFVCPITIWRFYSTWIYFR